MAGGACARVEKRALILWLKSSNSGQSCGNYATARALADLDFCSAWPILQRGAKTGTCPVVECNAFLDDRKATAIPVVEQSLAKNRAVLPFVAMNCDLGNGSEYLAVDRSRIWQAIDLSAQTALIALLRKMAFWFPATAPRNRAC